MSQLYTDQNFVKEVEESKEPVMVEFFAPWCGPCVAVAPILEELSKEYAGNGVKIGKVNVDENLEVAKKFTIMSIPTFIIFKDGKEVDRFIGGRSKKELEQKLSEVVGSK
jgi:thioredoxin 1